jgi:hypothetical protein
MKRYFVISFKPFSQKLDIKKFDDYDKAKAYADDQKYKNRMDVVLTEENTDENGKTTYFAKKYGFFKAYDIWNKILSFLAIMLVIFLSYLYYKFYKSKNV